MSLLWKMRQTDLVSMVRIHDFLLHAVLLQVASYDLGELAKDLFSVQHHAALSALNSKKVILYLCFHPVGNSHRLYMLGLFLLLVLVLSFG